MYYNRYQDVLQQINHENSMAEQIRQFNENKAMEQQKLNEQIRQFNASLAEEQRQYNTTLAWQKAQAAAKGDDDDPTPTPEIVKTTVKKSSGSTIQKPNAKKAGYTDTGSGKKTSGATIDMNSVLALGYGPISASKLNQLVQSGQVVQYTSGGKIKFKKSVTTNKYANLYKKG
jgi:hypothetical protein